jgi:hypothetical protein
MKNQGLFRWIWLILLLFTLGCKESTPDVSHISLSLGFQRMDLQLSEAAPKGPEAVKRVLDSFPDFSQIYVYQLLDLRVPEDSIPSAVARFYGEQDIRDLQDSVRQCFSNLQNEEEAMTRGFQFYQHYFPNRKVPQVVFYLFGFNYVAVPLEQTLYLSLDQYLGASSMFLGHLPDYIRSRRRKEYLAIDALKAWMMVDFDTLFERKNLGDEMIYMGKIHYILQKVFPGSPDSLRFGFSQAQLEFCGLNEYKIWNTLLEEEVLNTEDFRIKEKYLGEAPFSPGMPREAPGRVVEWVGARMVQQFLEQRQVSPDSLMHMSEQEILLRSGYRPKKQ